MHSIIAPNVKSFSWLPDEMCGYLHPASSFSSSYLPTLQPKLCLVGHASRLNYHAAAVCMMYVARPGVQTDAVVNWKVRLDGAADVVLPLYLSFRAIRYSDGLLQGLV